MTTDALHHQPLMPHLLIDGLNRYNDEPCLFLGDKVASYREVLDNLDNEVKPWFATQYSFLKRQASFNTGRWVTIENGRDVLVGALK